MEFLIIIAVLVAITVAPVMIGARIVGANNTGFGSALLAVVMLGAVSVGVDHFIGNRVLAFVVSATAGALLLAGILGTTFLRGLAVSAIVTVIQIAVMLVVVGALIGKATVDAG